MIVAQSSAGGLRWQGTQVRRPVVAAAAAKRNKPQQKKQRKPKGSYQPKIVVDLVPEDEEDEWGDEGEEGPGVPAGLTARIPKAPAPSAQRPELPPRPQDLYAVFPRDPAVTKMEDAAKASSSGGGGGGPSDEPQQPLWNPRTGFMKTRAQLDAEAAAAAAAAGAATGNSSSSGGSGGVNASGSRQGEAGMKPSAAAAGVPAAAAAGAAPLPTVTKGQVIQSCVGTTASLLVIAAVIRAYADASAADVLGTDPELLQRLLRLNVGPPGATAAAAAAGAAVAVTAARLTLLRVWPSFSDATDASNRQVLTPLGWPEIALISGLTGASEELLFRGALIPATFPDWRGVALSAAIFGALHNSGGRNAAFAAWAAGVGAVYGAAYLYTENIWVPVAAHAIANLASAAVWKTSNGGGGSGGGGAA